MKPATAGLAGVVGALTLVYALCMDSLHPWWTKRDKHKSHSASADLSSCQPSPPWTAVPSSSLFLLGCMLLTFTKLSERSIPHGIRTMILLSRPHIQSLSEKGLLLVLPFLLYSWSLSSARKSSEGSCAAHR